MKKVFLALFLAAFTLSVYSCRETTEEDSESIEDAGQELEESAEEAGEDIEEAGENVDEEF